MEISILTSELLLIKFKMVLQAIAAKTIPLCSLTTHFPNKPIPASTFYQIHMKFNILFGCSNINVIYILFTLECVPLLNATHQRKYKSLTLMPSHQHHFSAFNWIHKSRVSTNFVGKEWYTLICLDYKIYFTPMNATIRQAK